MNRTRATAIATASSLATAGIAAPCCRCSVLADAPDQVLPAAAKPVAGLRGGLGERG